MKIQRTSVKLAEKVSRIQTECTIQKNGIFQSITVIVDTGCMNTLIDTKIASSYGEKLPEKWSCNIGGRQVLTQAYYLDTLRFNTLSIKDILVFAADFTETEWKNGMLLGLNIMNNWNYTINKNNGTMIISEDIFNKIPDKQYAYMHWLKNGEYVKMQQELIRT